MTEMGIMQNAMLPFFSFLFFFSYGIMIYLFLIWKNNKTTDP